MDILPRAWRVDYRDRLTHYFVPETPLSSTQMFLDFDPQTNKAWLVIVNL